MTGGIYHFQGEAWKRKCFVSTHSLFFCQSWKYRDGGSFSLGPWDRVEPLSQTNVMHREQECVCGGKQTKTTFSNPLPRGASLLLQHSLSDPDGYKQPAYVNSTESLGRNQARWPFSDGQPALSSVLHVRGQVSRRIWKIGRIQRMIRHFVNVNFVNVKTKRSRK